MDLIKDLVGSAGDEDDGLDQFLELEERPESTVEVQEMDEQPIVPPSIGVDQIPSAAPNLDPEPIRYGRGKKKPGPKGKNPFESMLPVADRLLVYKRSSTGQLGFVGEYSPYDLARLGSIELFLREYVVPTYDYGEYALAIMKDGNQKPVGSVTIMPPKTNASREQTDSVQELFKLQMAMQDKAKKEAGENMDSMVKMMAMMNAGKKDEGGGMNMMMMFMMMNMMQKQQGPDPMMQMLMQKLLSRADEHAFPPPAPLPFMPAPSSGSGEMGLKEVIAIVRDMVKPNQPTSIAELASIAKLMKGDDDKLTVKDMIALMPTIKDMLVPKASGNESFRKVVEDFTVLQQLMNGGGDTSPGFWEFAGILAESLPALVAAKGGSTPPPKSQTSRVPKVAQSKLPSGAANGKPAQVPAFTPINVEQMKKGAPPIHPNFKRFADGMKAAFEEEDDGKIMEMFLRGLMFLRKTHPKWQKSVETTLQLMKDDVKDKARKYIEVFLHTFVDADLIEAEVAEAIDSCFEEHWAKARESMGFKTADVTEPAAEEAAEVVSAASSVVAAGGPDEPNTDDDDDDGDPETEEDDEGPLEIDDDDDDPSDDEEEMPLTE
jgi:hypothetical protein